MIGGQLSAMPLSVCTGCDDRPGFHRRLSHPDDASLLRLGCGQPRHSVLDRLPLALCHPRMDSALLGRARNDWRRHRTFTNDENPG